MKTLFLVLVALFLLVSCGDPVRLTMGEVPFEDQLDSQVEKPATKRAPKHKKARVPLIRRSISDVVSADTSSVTPPEPTPSVTPTPEPTEDKPTYVQNLENKTTVPTEAKYRSPVVMTTTLVPMATVPKGTGKVDIVFVVDVSHSMRQFLRSSRIRKVFKGFISALKPLDWQMMFTNADYGDRFFLFNLGAGNGKAMALEHDGAKIQRKFLNKQTPHHSSVFIDTLRRHDSFEYTTDRGDGTETVNQCSLAPGCQSMTFNEQPLKSLKSAWTKNRSFFRPSADVAVIIYSDSDEGEKHRHDSRRTKVKEVISAFEKQWGQDGKRLIAYGIIMVPGEDQECVDQYSHEGLFGTELARMAEVTGGTNYSLCDDSYVPLAKQMVHDFQEQ